MKLYKNSVLKNVLALLLIFVLAAAVFASCSSTEQPTPDASTKTSTEETASSPTESSTDAQTSQTTPVTETSETPTSDTATATATPTTETPTTETPVPEEHVVFTVGSVSGKAGEEIVVPVVLSENPGLAGYSITIEYDADKLTVVNAASSIGNYFIKNQTVDGRVRLMWTNSGINPLQTNGEICTVTFKIKDGAAAGTTTLTPSIYDRTDTVYRYFGEDGVMPEYPAAFVAGTVTIEQ